MNVTDRNRLVDKIFDKPFSCLIAPIYLDAAFPPPELKGGYQLDGRATASGCIRTVDNAAEQELLSILYGHTRYSGDQERDTKILNEPAETNLTINTMCEVLAVEGQFQFNDPADSTVVMEIVETYLKSLVEARFMEVHFKMPPEEDLEKLAFLRDSVRPLALLMHDVGMGKTRWDELINSFIVKGFSKGRGSLKEEKALEEKGIKTEFTRAAPLNTPVETPKPKPKGESTPYVKRNATPPKPKSDSFDPFSF